MKLKKLTAVVVVVIAIGLSLLGCNPLPPNSINSSSEEKYLPMFSEEQSELNNYLSDNRVYYLDFHDDEKENVLQNHFSTQFKENKTYFFIIDLAGKEDYLFNQFYLDYAIDLGTGKELMAISGHIGGNFDRPPMNYSSLVGFNYDYYFYLYSFGYKTYQSEFSYVLTEIEGYQYNKLITVFAGEEIVAKFYYYTLYNHIEDEYFLNFLKNYGFQAQINDDVIIQE